MSDVLNALTDPGVDALLGASQGFAQAAMPTRMPIPLGAALGMGAGGALQGFRQGQEAAQQQQQLQALKMQNQVAQSALPLALAKNSMLTDFWAHPEKMQQMMGGNTPFGVPMSASPSTAPMSNVGTPSASAPNGSYTKANTTALASLPDDSTRMTAINAALRAGLPQEAWAPWIATIAHESNWNLKAPDGTSGEIGPGQVMPDTGKTLGYTPDQLRDPATNLLASAQYFGQKWKEANGNPSGAFAGYNTGSVTGNAPDYVNGSMAKLTGYGYMPANADSVTSDALTKAQTYENQANMLERQQAQAKFMQSQGMPVFAPPGDPAALRQAAQQYRGLAMDRMKLIGTRAGVFDPATGKEVYRQPEYHEVQDPNTGVEYPAFVQPNDNGGLSVTGGPPGMNGQTPPTKIGPGQEDVIKHLADQYSNEDKEKYEGALNSLFQLDQQDKNIATLNSGGGWSATGAGANAKLDWAKGINSAFQTLGVKPPFDPDKVASWEDASKIQTQLAFAQAKQLGSREARQVIEMSHAATPGAENTPQGYQVISNGYHEMNNREVDLYNFKTQWLQSHGGNLLGAETAFNNAYTPKMYAQRAISVVNPVQINTLDQGQAMKEMQKYLPGTVVRFPNGAQKIVPGRDAAPPVPSYIQQNMSGGQNGG